MLSRYSVSSGVLENQFERSVGLWFAMFVMASKTAIEISLTFPNPPIVFFLLFRERVATVATVQLDVLFSVYSHTYYT